jgi:hypothetical protein
MTDINTIIETREKVHGEFWKTAEIAQELKTVIARHTDRPLDPVHDEALHMIASKVARILSGDPLHIDHWVDIAGYAQLGANFARAKTDV